MSEIIVKISSGDPALSELLLRQTPSRSGLWGNCRFFVNQEIEICDWWVICHGSSIGANQTTVCDPGHIVFISMEPSELDTPQRFYKQFSKIVLCDKRIRHPDKVLTNAMTWWVGIDVRFEGGHKFSPSVNHDYDSLSQLRPPEKINRISVITSNNQHLSGHLKRLEFIDKLRKHPIAEGVDFFGGGHNPVLDKLDALLPYKYHIALENSAIENYWSEKLADPFLAFALPIYYGCTNVGDYFSAQSMIKVDIDDFESTVNTLTQALEGDIYAERYPAILESRQKVLNQYNIFQIMADICNEKAVELRPCTITPATSYASSGVRSFTKLALKKLRKTIMIFWT